MAFLYSERLAVAHNVNSGFLEVDDAHVWVVRDIFTFAPGPVAGGTFQLVDRATGATIYYVEYAPSAAGVATYDRDMRLVLPAGSYTEVSADAGLGEGVDLCISGYSLSLP